MPGVDVSQGEVSYRKGDEPQRSEASVLKSARHTGLISRLVTARVAAVSRCTASAYRDSISTSSGSSELSLRLAAAPTLALPVVHSHWHASRAARVQA